MGHGGVIVEMNLNGNLQTVRWVGAARRRWHPGAHPSVFPSPCH